MDHSLPRGIELVKSQLAICLGGAAWLPFDMDTPADQMPVCLEDAAAVGMITTDEWYEHVLEVPQSKWTNTELQKTLHETVELAKSTPELTCLYYLYFRLNRKTQRYCHYSKEYLTIFCAVKTVF